MIQITEKEIMQNWQGNTYDPVVSIFCITYNHEKFIAEALDSFLMQKTDFPFEIVIDDDCSTDSTANTIQSYVDRFPNIISAQLRNKNVGVSKNALGCASRAKGEFLAFCEGDDYWIDEYKLQYQIAKMNEFPECEISVHPVEILKAKSIIGISNNYSEKNLLIDTSTIIANKPFPTSSMIIKRKAFEIHYPFVRQMMIIDHTVQILLSLNMGVLFLSKVMSCYRINPNGITSSKLNTLEFFQKEMVDLLRTYTELNKYLEYKWDEEFHTIINYILTVYFDQKNYAVSSTIKIYKEYEKYIKEETRIIFLNNLYSNLLNDIEKTILLLSPDKIDFLRDKALEVESSNLQLAYNLMYIAYQARPSGPFIIKKMAEYKLKLQ